MNKKSFLAHISALYNKCLATVEKKNADYSGKESNAFKNFEAVEQFAIAETKQGIMVRLSDKFTRIANLLNHQAYVKSESLQDSIEDAINYLAILHARVTYELERKTNHEDTTEFPSDTQLSLFEHFNNDN